MANPSEAYRLVTLAISDTNQDQAVSLLKRAIDLDDMCKLAFYHLGLIFACRGMHNEAADSFRQIVTVIDDSDAPAWFVLARQLHLAARPEEAMSAYEETLRRDALCEKAYLYSAEILLEGGKSPDRALSFAEAARRLRPRTCMLPVEYFDSVLMKARSGANSSDHRSHEESWLVPVANDSDGTTGGTSIGDHEISYENIPVRVLVEKHPAIVDVLEAAGIRCSNCAGYGDQTLGQLVTELELDLVAIERDVILSIGG